MPTRSRYTQYGLQARRAAKWLAIRGGLEAISLATTSRLIPQRSSRGVIFTMHHVRPERDAGFSPNAHLSITPEFLTKTIAMLLERGWIPVRLEDLPELLDDPNNQGRYMAFTLDDGYRDNRDYAQAVFESFDIPFTVFVASGFTLRSRSIWWETLEAFLARTEDITVDFGKERYFDTSTRLKKYVAFDYISDLFPGDDEDRFVAWIDATARRIGVDPIAIVEREVMDKTELRAFNQHPLVSLGAHTVNHISLAHATDSRIEEEIRQSADFVADITGESPKSFAFPYGDGNAARLREFKTIAELGFDIAVTTRPGLLKEKHCLMLTAMPRVSLNGYHQNTRYVRALLSGLPFLFAGQKGKPPSPHRA